MQKVALILSLVGMAADIVIPFFAAKLVPGYSPKLQDMSALGSRSARSGRLYSCWMLLFGVIVCFAGWNGYRPFSSPVGILICVFGTAACILSFFFRAGEGKEDKSVGSRIHGIASAVGFIALLPADILSAVSLMRSGLYVAGYICTAFFVFALMFFALYVMSDKPYFKGTPFGMTGAWQRMWLICMYLPLAVVAAVLLITL